MIDYTWLIPYISVVNRYAFSSNINPIITLPAIVPTTVDDKPDAISDTPNNIEAAFPTSGSNVLYAVSISATCWLPLA